jgi:hypothetical protein
MLSMAAAASSVMASTYSSLGSRQEAVTLAE